MAIPCETFANIGMGYVMYRGLPLILAHLFRSSVRWRNADVRLKMVIDDDSAL